MAHCPVCYYPHCDVSGTEDLGHDPKAQMIARRRRVSCPRCGQTHVTYLPETVLYSIPLTYEVRGTQKKQNQDENQSEMEV